MSQEDWTTTTHIINASYRRAFARGLRDEAGPPLRLVVKQYARGTPAQPGDATIVFVHGVGSVKETYEPFFDELLRASGHIRSLWSWDTAHHGESYTLNKDVLGDMPSWFDAGRDLIHLINVFQGEMPPPLIVVAQSVGAIHAIAASGMHPRLFDGMVLVEPPLWAKWDSAASKYGEEALGVRIAKKPDAWRSRGEARAFLTGNKFYYGRFDPRVVNKIVAYELRVMTADEAKSAGIDYTSLDIARDGPPVCLKTPKVQEVYSLMNVEKTVPGHVGAEVDLEKHRASPWPGFYKPDAIPLWRQLETLAPPLLYVWGEFSELAPFKDFHHWLMSQSGADTARGGNGGTKSGKVRELTVPDVMHAIPFEKPKVMAEAIVPWLTEQSHAWVKEGAKLQREFFIDKVPPGWMAKF